MNIRKLVLIVGSILILIVGLIVPSMFARVGNVTVREVKSVDIQIDNMDNLTFSVQARGWDPVTGIITVRGLVATIPTERVTVLSSTIDKDSLTVTVAYNGYGRKFTRTILVKYDELSNMVIRGVLAEEQSAAAKTEWGVKYDVTMVTFTDTNGVY